MKFMINSGEIFDTYDEALAAEQSFEEKTKEQKELQEKLDQAYDAAIQKIEEYAELYGQIYGVSGKDFLTLCSMVEDAKNESESEGNPIDAGPLTAFLIDFFG